MTENRENNTINTSLTPMLSKWQQNFINQFNKDISNKNITNHEKNHSSTIFESVHTPNKRDETSADSIKRILPYSLKAKRVTDMNNTFQINHKRIHALDLSLYNTTKTRKLKKSNNIHNNSMIEAKTSNDAISPYNSHNDINDCNSDGLSPTAKNFDNLHEIAKNRNIPNNNSNGTNHSSHSIFFPGKKTRNHSHGLNINLEPIHQRSTGTRRFQETETLTKTTSKTALLKLGNENIINSTIQHLIEENDLLKKRIDSLKDVNGRLADACQNQNILPRDELHSIYHMLYVDDYKKEIAELQMKITALKIKNSEKNKIIANFEKEIKSLKSVIENYRNMVNDRGINNISNTGGNNESKIGTRRMDSEASISVTTIAPQHEKKATRSTMDIGLYDKFAHLIKSCGENNSILNIMRSIVNDSCKLFECGLARMLITSPKVKKIWREAGGVSNEKFMLGHVELDLITKKELVSVDDTVLNSIENMDSLKKFYNKEGQAISCPINSYVKKGTMLCVLQIAEPITSAGGGQNKTKRRKGFSIKEELLINLYSKIVTLILDTIMYQEKIKKVKAERDNFVNVVTDFCMDNSPQDLLYSIKNKAPRHLKFQKIGVLFYDVKENTLYTYDTQKQVDGKFFSVEPLKYPIKLGITGYCFMHDIKLMVVNDPRRNKYFQPEIDNTGGASTVENLIIGLLKNTNGEKVGVIQLINREGKKEVEKKDEVLLERLLGLFGALVSHNTKVSGTIGLTYALRTTMDKIQQYIQIDSQKLMNNK